MMSRFQQIFLNNCDSRNCSDINMQHRHHLWAEALAPLYAAGDTATTPDSSAALKATRISKFSAPAIRIHKKGSLLYIEKNGKRFNLTGHQF